MNHHTDPFFHSLLTRGNFVGCRAGRFRVTGTYCAVWRVQRGCVGSEPLEVGIPFPAPYPQDPNPCTLARP